MKARLLKKLLNDTRYNVHETEGCICVGSPLCPDLINVNKETLQIKYALDTFREGRKSLEEKSTKSAENELLFIWDKLQELIDNGQIKDIIAGYDTIENPLPVFACQDGIIIETFTYAYGWPNTTIDGTLMYNNTWFKTREEAVAYGIKDIGIALKWAKENLEQKEKEVQKSKDDIKKYQEILDNLIKQQL